ncbi:MAG TPA: metalloregulator ArsR/SmtB family transcription factor [Thermaerobacter sp.]
MLEPTRPRAVDAAEPDQARWLAGMGRALSDPARARILLLLAQGRACCEGLERQAPAETGDGVCVCELEEVLGLRQSLVSYHLRLLKEAGLVRETRRGRWSYYALDRTVLKKLADKLSALASTPPSEPADRPRDAEVGADLDGKGVTKMKDTRDPRERRNQQPGGFGAAASATTGCCGEESCCGDTPEQATQATACCEEPACCDDWY